MRNSKRGYILSLDASIAVLIALVMIASILFYLSQSSHSKIGESLNSLSLDSLSLLEKSGALSETAMLLEQGKTKTHALDEYLDSLPYNTCARITLYRVEEDTTLTKILTHTRVGCTIPSNYIISKRVFIAQRATYLAELEAWQK